MMSNGSVQVLFPDGALSRCASLPSKHVELVKPTSATSSRPTQESLPGGKKGQRGVQPPKTPDELLPPPPVPVKEKVAEWISTKPEGERIATNSDGEVVELSPVLSAKATCPHTKQVLKTREDNVILLDRPDGTLVVEHADGTRFTTFYADVKQEVEKANEETGENATYEMVSMRHVKVECEGFATVIMNILEGSCKTVFGNGTCIEMQPDGASVFTQTDGSEIHFNTKGDAVFIPKDVQYPIIEDVHRPANGTPITTSGIYVMRTTNQQCCEMADKEGNFFTVLSNGDMDMRQVALSEWETSVDESNPAINEDDVFKQEDNKDSSEADANRPPSPIFVVQKIPHSPRFFIVHSDGSGSELLHQADVAGILNEATLGDSTAVLKTPVEGHSGVTGITILKPYAGGVSKIWLKSKDEKTIIPGGLRERDFTVFPARESKTPGPKFGTRAGRGVNVGNISKPPPPAPPITCPRALELRQFIQYQPLTLEQRSQIVRAMAAYADFTTKREEKSDNLLPQEPRSEDEVKTAQDIEEKMNGDKDEEELDKEKEKETAVDEQASEVGSSHEIPPLRDEVKETVEHLADQVQSAGISEQYVEAITPPVIPPPEPPKWKRPIKEWEKDRIELAELEYAKHSIRYGLVPPYFDTAQGQAFLNASKAVDMEALTKDLAMQTRHPPQGQSTPASTPEVDTSQTGYTSDNNNVTSDDQGLTPQTSTDQITLQQSISQLETPSPAVADDSSFSPTKMRPNNPTPAHAAGKGTPTPLRPNNPTPAHAALKQTGRPTNPTPLEGDSELNEFDGQRQSTLESVQELEYDTTMEEDNNGTADFDTVEQDQVNSVDICSPGEGQAFGVKSLYRDVTGQPRKNEVKLPNSILSSKPGALPNTQYHSIEDPVRRRIQTVSVTGGDPISQVRVKSMRGFELLPPEVDFGVLKEGCTYRFPVLLKNIGIDSCRYKIKQPPPSTGLRVVFIPGPVAAGMSVRLEIEIFAVAVGVEGERGVGSVGHHIEIVTENEALYLPVSATIVTAYEYENPTDGIPVGQPNPEVFEMSTRPSSRDAIRPRRE